MKNLLYIGLDVHKDSITIAVAEPGRDGEMRSQGKMSNSLHAVDKFIARLRKQYAATSNSTSATKRAPAVSFWCVG